MSIDFLLKRKKSPGPENHEQAPAPTDRRSSRLERRRRADRRGGNNLNYTGASRRETIDQRKVIAERREDVIVSLLELSPT
jgi:hypothetical protein